MKWVTLISCIFLLCFAESKHLYRVYRDAEHIDTIKRSSELPTDLFAGICLIVYAQLVQKETYEVVHKLMDDTLALAKKCAADEHSAPECEKPLHTVVLDEICHEQGIAEKSGFAACCAKADPERHDCFLAHKNGSREYIPPFQKPEPEAACKHFHDNKQDILGHYTYELARRNPYAKIVTILHGAQEFEKVLTDCCPREDKNACFAEKGLHARKKLKKAIALEKYYCLILKKFGKPELLGWKLAQLSQKFPKADSETAGKLTEAIVHTYEECCKGNTLDCLFDRDRLTQYVCSHQDSISSKLKDCCERPILERGECIAHAENDDKPADLTPVVKEYIENPAVCQHYAEKKEVHIGNFLHAYARSHGELPITTVLRISKDYIDLLEACCTGEHPETCLAAGEGKLKKRIDDIKAQLNTRCDLYKQLGPYHFQNEIILRYSKKAPQLSAEQLQEFSKNVVDVVAECCQKDDAHKLTCANQADVAVGYLCYLHEQNHINKQVCKCCNESFVNLRDCFINLQADPEYVPIIWDSKGVTFHEDYCTASLEEQQKKKQTVLINLIKYKPDITHEQCTTVTVDLDDVTTKCCTPENKEECFGKEIPELILRTKTALGEH